MCKYFYFTLFLPQNIEYYNMADNFLERQYAAYEERKAAMKSGKKASASKTKFYTRPGKKVEK